MPTANQDVDRRRLRWFGLLLLAAAAAVMPWDYEVARQATSDRLPGDLRTAINLAEVFAHGIGVGFILLTVAVLDQRGWKIVWRLAASAYLSGLAANAAKFLIARQRPRFANLTGSALGSFRGWLPVLNPENYEDAFDHAIQSFPSGHTATAFGLAIGLGMTYPRGRWLFFFFAVLAGLQRIFSSAHFPSDVLVGAALACLIAPSFAPRGEGART